MTTVEWVSSLPLAIHRISSLDSISITWVFVHVGPREWLHICEQYNPSFWQLQALSHPAFTRYHFKQALWGHRLIRSQRNTPQHQLFSWLHHSGAGSNLKVEGHNFRRRKFFFTVPLHFFVVPPTWQGTVGKCRGTVTRTERGQRWPTV